MSESIFSGTSLAVSRHDGVIELRFAREGDAVNKLDFHTLAELEEALSRMRQQTDVKGALLTSGKEAFIAGADITEFRSLFALPRAEMIARNLHSNRVLTALETLPFPTVAAIQGYALGGGLEVALACDFRVATASAQLGLPEVRLGLLPGLGGTVRLPRVAGPAVALEWITRGQPAKAAVALDAGVIDAVSVLPEELLTLAGDLLDKAAADESLWRTRRERKALPFELSATLLADAQLGLKSPPHQPAAQAAIELLRAAAPRPRDEALQLEADTFARIATTQAAGSLVQIFLSEQSVKKRARQQGQQGAAIKSAALVGAGIMGGGIACANAQRGIAVAMMDLSAAQLESGMAEIRRLLSRKLAAPQLERTLQLIRTQLDYTQFSEADIVIEAVVEDLRIKQSVLRDIEVVSSPHALLASNTSSLRIDELAAQLNRPENFLGLHFFNPVPMMPLVEVIRGTRTSAAAVATAVRYVSSLGKTPVVVKDGPGFLVNRLLTPYMLSFSDLVGEGADFEQIDRAMEEFGWPMGPAYLNDVVGLDTADRVSTQICAGFPHLLRPRANPLGVLVQAQRLGQKTGAGFYQYEPDERGKPRRVSSAQAHELLDGLQRSGRLQFSAQEICERLMLPMILEAAICLEEETVGSAAELDMAMLLGVGFPQYLGGPLKYADWLGNDVVADGLERYGYAVPAWFRARGLFYDGPGGRVVQRRPNDLQAAAG